MWLHKVLKITFEILYVLGEEGAVIGVVNLVKTDESHCHRAQVSLDFDETVPLLDTELVPRPLQHPDLHGYLDDVLHDLLRVLLAL